MKRLLIFLILLSACVINPSRAQNPTFRAQNFTAAGGCTGFPCNSILDDFNRANEGPPPSASWATPIGPGAGGLKVVSNLCATNGAPSEAYRNTSFNANQEVYATIIDATDRIYLSARIANPNTAGVTTYQVSQQSSAANILRVWRVDNSTTGTQLGADISQTIASGDSFGFSIVGSTITVYYCLSGSGCGVGGAGWTSLGTRTDATYNNAGFIGASSIDAGAGTGVIDDFGGGNR